MLLLMLYIVPVAPVAPVAAAVTVAHVVVVDAALSVAVGAPVAATGTLTADVATGWTFGLTAVGTDVPAGLSLSVCSGF